MQFMDQIKDVVVTNKASLYYIIFCAFCVRRLIFNFLRFELIVVDSSYIVSDVQTHYSLFLFYCLRKCFESMTSLNDCSAVAPFVFYFLFGVYIGQRMTLYYVNQNKESDIDLYLKKYNGKKLCEPICSDEG